MTDSSNRNHGPLPARVTPIPAPVVSADYVDDYAEAAPLSAGKRISPKLLWRAFRRYWWQALLLWVVATLGFMFLAYTRIKPTYDAIARVKVKPNEGGIWNPKNADPTHFNEFKETQVLVVTNPVVLGLALTMHPELYNLPMLRGAQVDAEAEIRRALNVQVIPKTSLMQIAMTSPIPTEAATVVNAVVDAYLKNSQTMSDDETERQIKRLRDALEEREVDVKNKRDIIKSISKKLGSADTSSVKDRNNITLDDYRRYSVQLTEIEIQRIAAQARVDELRGEKAVPARLPDPREVDEAVREMFYEHPRVAQLQADRERAEAALAKALRITRNTNDPSCAGQRQKVRELTAQIDRLWRSLEPKLRNQVLRQFAGDTDGERLLAEAERQLTSLKSQEEALKAKLDKMTIDSKSSGSDALSLEFARRDFERAELTRGTVQANLDDLIFKAKDPKPQIELEFKAKPSIKPNKNHRKMAMAASPIAAAFLVMGLLVVWELRGGRVADPDELPARVRLQVLGVVPPLPRIRSSSNGAVPATRRDFRAQRQLDEFVQSLDHLRVALCSRPDSAGRDRHCVLITSACGSEGKTTLAAQLAERCVNAGLMTLLIDGDLRNPTLSRMLDAEGRPGLINVLRGESSPEDAIMVVGDAGGFHFLPAGNPRLDPSRLLQGDALGRLIAQARESFEMIIVDAPPVLPVPDALTIGRWTDGAVLAVRYDTSRIPLVERASRRLAHVGIPVIGAVVNGVRTMESSSYGYGGYYAYGASPTAESSGVAEG